MENKKINMVIQVCYELTVDNKDKEIEGLMEAMSFFNLKKGIILTYNQEDEFHVENKYVEVKPIWKWL